MKYHPLYYDGVKSKRLRQHNNVISEKSMSVTSVFAATNQMSNIADDGYIRKTCVRCDQTKSASEFQMLRNNRRHPFCKECMGELTTAAKSLNYCATCNEYKPRLDFTRMCHGTNKIFRMCNTCYGKVLLRKTKKILRETIAAVKQQSVAPIVVECPEPVVVADPVVEMPKPWYRRVLNFFRGESRAA